MISASVKSQTSTTTPSQWAGILPVVKSVPPRESPEPADAAEQVPPKSARPVVPIRTSAAERSQVPSTTVPSVVEQLLSKVPLASKSIHPASCAGAAVLFATRTSAQYSGPVTPTPSQLTPAEPGVVGISGRTTASSSSPAASPSSPLADAVGWPFSSGYVSFGAAGKSPIAIDRDGKNGPPIVWWAAFPAPKV